MTSQITVPLPLNIADEELSLFEPYVTYEMFDQKIKRLKNIFVSFSGFCLNKSGLLKECHHNYPLQHNYYLNEVSQYYYDVIDHPENLIKLDDDNTYLVIHHPWFNYYHWICESIFRLWLVRDQLDKLVLILPDFYKDADFITGSLEPFKIKNIFYIPSAKSLMVRNLCLPEIKSICDSYNIKQIKQVRDFYTNYVLFEKKFSVDHIDKLYVSRQLAPRRKVINEDEVLRVVKRYGFTIFHPENFTFLEQVAIFSRVKYLVGTHGSGLTNLLFMGENSSLLELHKNKTNELNHPSPLFWYMAKALDVNYHHQACDTYGKEDYFEGDYIIDINLLEKNLVKMLN
jgi:capsular polysaccharide biosynthesis protein